MDYPKKLNFIKAIHGQVVFIYTHAHDAVSAHARDEFYLYSLISLNGSRGIRVKIW